MDPTTVADILGGDEGIPLPEVSPESSPGETTSSIGKRGTRITRSSHRPQYEKFFAGEDISSEAIIESDMARTYAANKNLGDQQRIISVLVLVVYWLRF